MSSLHKAIRDIFDDVPRKLLRELVERKLEETGILLPPETIDALVMHCLSGAEGEFVWNGDEGHRDLKLIFTKEDGVELEEAVQRILETAPEVVSEALEKASESLFKSLWEQWPVQRAMQDYEIDGFRERMEERWGEGLDYLRMLLTCCREMGQETYKRHNKSRSRRHMFRRWVLVRLHTRACQISDEIICLMENGFADGAMARWRTLHELSVVALLIADGDEDLAERYILHDAVEVKRQADEYDQTQVPAGFAPLNIRDRKRIDASFDAVIGRFGPTFAHPYGWAAKHLNMKKPSFKELQVAADRMGFSSFYKLASFNVHASARSLFFNLASMGEDVLLAGRSNAGLTEPGERTAQTLLLVTSLYVGDVSANMDRLAQLKTLMLASEKVGPALARAERRLKRDERAHQKTRTRGQNTKGARTSLM